jgi:hypothetical protein
MDDFGTPARTPLRADEGGAAGGTIDRIAPRRVIPPVYDTATRSRPAGVRAILEAGSRCLLFETDRYEILVRVTPHRLTGGYELIGQVLFRGLPVSGVTTRIEADGEGATILTDRGGGFGVPRLTGATCRISIAVDGAVLTTPPIALGPSEDAADPPGPSRMHASRG